MSSEAEGSDQLEGGKYRHAASVHYATAADCWEQAHGVETSPDCVLARMFARTTTMRWQEIATKAATVPLHERASKPVTGKDGPEQGEKRKQQ